MAVDRYTRIVLTVIAAALVYLCVVVTPLPTAHAQRGQRPGDDTGPAQVVVVGWRPVESPTIRIDDSMPLRVSGDVRVDGLVQVDQATNKAIRVVAVGWEKDAVLGPKPIPGQPRTLSDGPSRGLPVTDNAPRQ